MATNNKPSVVCGGGCGRLLWRGTGSARVPVCRSCRRSLPVGGGVFAYPFPFPRYSDVHLFLNSTLGPASDRRCHDCPRPALHWAYDHADPDERHDRSGANAAYPFSVYVGHYRALCGWCHNRLDREHRGGRSA